MLWEWEVGVCLDCECVEFVIAGWSKLKFYDFYNSKLKEVMRNLTCGVGVYQILLLVIRFVLTRVETDFSWTCFSRCGGGVGGGGRNIGGRWNRIYFFGGLLLGDSNAEKWGDHQKKKFFINNSVDAVISWNFGLLKLHVLFTKYNILLKEFTKIEGCIFFTKTWPIYLKS